MIADRTAVTVALPAGRGRCGNLPAVRTLVTGGAGFIGSNLADALVEAGDEVLALDDLSTGKEGNLDGAIAAGATLVRGDITIPGVVAGEVKAFEPDRIVHLAAQADVRKANEDPVFDAAVNVTGTIHVLEAARQGGRVPVVFAATGGAVYGEGENARLPFEETVIPAPESAYGVSKWAGEAYVGLYRRLHGVPGVALRFGNVYGPRQDPHGEAGVVAIFCGRLLDGDRVRVFGDGLQTRDYIYVDDVVASVIAASDALERGGTSIEGPFNIGTGEESTVLDLLEILAPLSGGDSEPEIAPARPGEVQRVSIDPARAGQELGWSPQVALDDGLRTTLNSVRAERAASEA